MRILKLAFLVCTCNLMWTNSVYAVENTTMEYSANQKPFVCQAYKKRKANVSGKDGAKDVPSWVITEGHRPCKTPNEDGKSFATRILMAKYGYVRDEEFTKIQKFGDRAFE